jgi:hypothetical protein
MSIYSILNQSAKEWWWHKKLRSEGNVKEARRRERDSIKSHTKYLRETLDNGGYLSIGRGGWTLHISDNHRLSHYGGIERPISQCCLILGIPIIDSTVVNDKDIFRSIKFPMVGILKPTPPPFDSLSYAPLEYVANLYKEIGANLYNF